MSRIKIRVSSGVFEVSLIRVNEEAGAVEVLWDRGVKREFKWGSVVFGNTDGPVLQKPAEMQAVEPKRELSAGARWHVLLLSISHSLLWHHCADILLGSGCCKTQYLRISSSREIFSDSVADGPPIVDLNGSTGTAAIVQYGNT